MGNELWSGQAQNGVNSYFEVKFDLERQGQLPPPPPPGKNQRTAVFEGTQLSDIGII